MLATPARIYLHELPRKDMIAIIASKGFINHEKFVMDFGKSGALLGAVFIGLSVVANAQTPSRDRIPNLNVAANCKATQEIDETLAEPQSYDACIRDEMTAQQHLEPVWGSTPEAVRAQCTGEAVMGGIESYVDLISCIQMAGFGQSSPPATSLRGASKNRNTRPTR